jgi:signal transduction histidine kinase
MDLGTESTSAADRGGIDVFAGDSEVARLCRTVDWSATPLGDPARWPLSLRTTVRIMLGSRFAMWMAWGPDVTMLYNDAYARMSLGAKHPWALGRPAREVWAEIWPDIGPRIEAVMSTGIATWDEALQLFLLRSGYPEETYHTFSYSPLAGDDGAVTGMLCVVSEETDRVIADRRLASLRDLAAGLAAVVREDDVMRATASALHANLRDLPFASLYLLDGDKAARLGSASGVAAGDPLAPELIELGPDQRWPVADVIAGRSTMVVADLRELLPAVLPNGWRLPTGDWEAAPARVAILPVAQSGSASPDGFLIAGLNPFRPLDAEYDGFLRLVAGQVGASLATTRLHETERKRAEELAALDRAKTRFFSNVSHEFRTPLALLLGPAEDALASPDTTPDNRERLGIIHRNALRMLRLVNNLLDFSRIEAGRVTASHEATDLGPYTAELASSFRSAMDRAGLTLTVDAPSGIESYVDRELWEKIVLNLVSNAFKHTFAGGVTIRVSSRGDQAVLQVSDTGVGIPAEQLPHIFERFHRVPNARSRTHEGTGIGLALVQELVRLHHGTIAVESTPDVGTTFTIALPRGSAHLRPEQLAAPANRDSQGRRLAGPASVAFVEEATRWLSRPDDDGTAVQLPNAGGRAHPAGPLAGTRVLVADDNADMRDYVTRLLRDRGCVVTAVADGIAALAAARDGDPELIVSDVMMPGLDGFELLRALRSDATTRRTPVILLSARAGEEARVEGIAAGADDYLVKPFSARELVARVEGRVQLDRTRRATEREREQLLARVEAERARLQTVFAQAPAAIAVLEGPRHVFASANAYYQSLVGNRPLIGREIRDALPEIISQGLVAVLDEVYRTATPYLGTELRVMLDTPEAPGPREYFFTFIYQPIVDSSGASTGIFIHAVDVTSQVRARQEAEMAKDVAERANRAKSDFLAAMSHELRTPLNAIGGYTQLIALGVHGPITEAQEVALSRVQRSQQHLLSLINDVLNFAKLEAGRVEYHIEDVDLARLATAVAPMVEPQLAERKLTYVERVEPGLAARADVDRLQQIVLNLLSNAVKFTESGGQITLEARRASANPAQVEIRVTDTGIGIARDKLESIFDPFVQAHRNLTRSTEGTGLGLAISRDLARAMNGELRVESDEGKGSTFTIVLPAARSSGG